MSADRSGDCLFCRFAAAKTADDEGNGIIYRGRGCFIIINAYPYSNGHVMVVLKRHVEHLNDLDEAEGRELIELVARCEKAILDAYNPGGINIGANLGRSAGAGIPGHLHMHLVPRWHGDTNFMTTVGETRVVSEDLVDTYKRLKSSFS